MDAETVRTAEDRADLVQVNILRLERALRAAHDECAALETLVQQWSQQIVACRAAAGAGDGEDLLPVIERVVSDRDAWRDAAEAFQITAAFVTPGPGEGCASCATLRGRLAQLQESILREQKARLQAETTSADLSTRLQAERRAAAAAEAAAKQRHQAEQDALRKNFAGERAGLHSQVSALERDNALLQAAGAVVEG